jgi:hypothetical protein
MRRLFFLAFILFSSAHVYCQQVTTRDLIGVWDQMSGPRRPSMIFIDSLRVKFSYKDRTGSSRAYYYILDNSKMPAVLTVDFKKDHRKHRDEYLIQMTDKDTLKLQVIGKKTPRDHFDENKPDKIYTLVKRS